MNRKNIARIILTLILVACLMKMDFSVAMADEGDYQIRINIAANRATVFTKGETGAYDVEVRTMACSVYENAKEMNVTILGKNEWVQWTDSTFSKYVCQIARGVYISSSPYSAKSDDALLKDQYNGLGENKSNMNIWFSCADAKWIYENCALKASIVLYNDETNPGSANTPVVVKLSDRAQYPNWDPTNDSEANPWKNCTATIEGTKDLLVEEGTEINLLENVKGYDLCGNEITKSILIMGVYDFNTPGTYDVTYYVKDVLGTQINVPIKLTVTKKNVPEETTETTIIEETTGTETVYIEEKKVDTGKTKGEKVRGIIVIGIITLLITLAITKYTKNR